MLKIRKKIYGEEHPFVAESYLRLAVDYRNLTKYNEAKECDEKALAIRRKIYGEEHPDVKDSRRRVAVDLRLSRLDDAKECDETGLIYTESWKRI